MRERLKSLLLAALLLLSVGLFYISLTLGAGGALLPEGLLDKWTDPEGPVSTGEGSGTFTAAARPEKLCLLTENGLYQAFAAEEYESLWREVQPFYEEGLGSGGAPVSMTDAAFADALRAPAVLLTYEAALPFFLLRAWSDAPDEDSVLTVRSVVLCAGAEGVGLLFRDGDGLCWRMDTAASAARLTELCAGGQTENAVLAGRALSAGLMLPEEPLLRGWVELPELTLSPVAAAEGGELPRSVLSAFALNPYLANVYQNAEGGTVYVEGRSTLLVSRSGDLVYSAAEGGVSVELRPGEDDDARAARVCELVSALLTGVWSDLSADGTLCLDRIDYDAGSGVCTLRYELERGGRFLDLQDRCWAQAVVKNGVLTDLTLCPRRVTEGEMATLIPMTQAAAAVAGPAARMSVRWLMEGGALRPALCEVE